MSHLIDFSITGLTGRTDKLERKLNRDVNIFFGLNGSGKTSLLRILDAAMSNDVKRIVGVPFTTAEVRIYSAAYKTEFLYTFKKSKPKATELGTQPALFANLVSEIYPHFRVGRNDTGEVVSYITTEEIASWDIQPPLPPDTEGKWSHTFLPTTRLYEHIRRQREEVPEDLDLRFEKTFERRWLDFFGKIQARVRDSQQQGLAEILNEVVQDKPDSEQREGMDWIVAYNKVRTFLERQNPQTSAGPKEAFRSRFEKSALLRKVVAHIDRVERDIDDAMLPRTKLEALIQHLFTGNKKLRFGPVSVEVVTSDDKQIGLRALSSGEKQILRILLEVIQAENSTLMIDEPELSMHVDWQKEIVSAMRELNPDTQLILATHSPEIMADIDDSKIFRI